MSTSPNAPLRKTNSQGLPSAPTGPTDTSGTCSGGRTRQLRFAEHSARTRAPMLCLLWRFSSNPRRMMPRPSECFRIHWKSVDTTCNCEQPKFCKKAAVKFMVTKLVPQVLFVSFCHQSVVAVPLDLLCAQSWGGATAWFHNLHCWHTSSVACACMRSPILTQPKDHKFKLYFSY